MLHLGATNGHFDFPVPGAEFENQTELKTETFLAPSSGTLVLNPEGGGRGRRGLAVRLGPFTQLVGECFKRLCKDHRV